MKSRSVFILLSIVSIIGCGLGKKDLNDIKLLEESEKVVYDSSGQYDLTEYLFPFENQTSVYQVVSYRDKDGDKNYNLSQPLNFNVSKRIEYVVADNFIEEGIDITYTIDDLKIREEKLIDDFYDIRDYRRYVDIGDTYYSYENIDAKDAFYQIGWLTCHIEEHNRSKKILDRTYQDVLTLFCKSESAQGVRGEFSEKRVFTTRFYFAKNIGKIASVGETCTTKRYNKNYKSCRFSKKELKEILK